MGLNSYGDGYGDGGDYGYGYGYGYGDGYGGGYGDGYGHGYGYGYGDGHGYGYGGGYGDGDGHGYGYGGGYGYGDGYGYGYGDELHKYLSQTGGKLQPARVLSVGNAELKRMMIEAIGADRFFRELGGQVVHQDTDGHGNPRQLVSLKFPDAQAGYLLAVHVVCPTTGRKYYLGVPPNMKTCQEAVASTFVMRTDEYKPERES